MGWHERATAAHVIVETSLGITMADPLWVALFRSPPWPGLISSNGNSRGVSAQGADGQAAGVLRWKIASQCGEQASRA